MKSKVTSKCQKVAQTALKSKTQYFKPFMNQKTLSLTATVASKPIVSKSYNNLKSLLFHVYKISTVQQCKIMPASTILLNVFCSESQASTGFVGKHIHSPHGSSMASAQSTMTTEGCSKCSCTVTQPVLQPQEL